MSGQKLEDMKCRQCGYAHPIGSNCPPASSLAAPTGSDDQRLIMVKASDVHVIEKYDSIDGPVMSHRGIVQAPSLACNVPDAVGKLAREYNAVGRQVWTGKMMTVRNGKIIRQNAPGERPAATTKET